ncbi:hypothetical protein AJ85_02255 [Alkalihalobacillus alcalophilus ATCC 27647 = CGMCC 1.3604]|uniref:DUF1002 domain-containing protein n=1 Tax=Alkalihalobacillus alcalophilus ATCC 27647 = CGMCC 1.3604 TaxID=1218173 RepID=A0A094WCM9_ALKAL|nr:DUF1002 domain-containing protein [Alkalihalobacillus alcalophilus]KGA95539.1 hypothetical protein BALCAV_0222000 [Alkalihalobacillus alcalophilus ATCC 27647 = CGMCC 1.3604]MED1564090.1 DUF1002 domain-containing protein [Alkalihalobacillus alcalophilus]THG88582.1 hypothetical protein AJ85_02255 [Alkalihalobacillus alcalophilus ATCC 27647 = CGMCC 1.3604]
MNKRWKKVLICLMLFALLWPTLAFADAVPGDIIITLGEDLNNEQKQRVLDDMGVKESDVEIIYVTNQEEHQYLGEYVNAATIGTRAISSSKITLAEPGTGITVETNNVYWVSEGMYANALITAGVEDAVIYVTAPFSVSGTGALTGLIKAYEIATDTIIPEEQKQIANEEIVKTSELGESIGVDEATELMNRIKEEMANNPVETEDDLRELIRRVAAELGITLTDTELDGLVSLFMRMKDLNINWDDVKSQISKVRDNLDDILNSEQTRNFLEKFLDFLGSVVDSIRGFFSSSN